MTTLKSLALFLLLITALAGQSMAESTQASPPTDQQTFTLYQYKGASKHLGNLDKQLQADARFKEQGCEKVSASTRKRAPSYVCKLNDAKTLSLFNAGVGGGVQLNATTSICPTGCSYMRCPPPIGIYRCCNNTNFQPC